MRANLTLFTKSDSDGVMTKTISDDGNGGLNKDASQCKMARGAAENRCMMLEDMPDLLTGLSDNQALSLCNMPRQKVDIVARGIHFDGAIERSLENFSWTDGPCFLLFDIDPHTNQRYDSENALLEAMELAWPGVSQTARVASNGTSSFIYDQEGRQRSGAGSFHLYFLVEDIGAALNSLPGTTLSEKLHHLRQHILVRMWNAGLGFIFITRDGRQLPRTIIDLAVLSPERLIFEAKPRLPDGWTQKRPTPTYVAGSYLPTEIMTKPLTREEKAKYQQTLKQAKADTKAEADSKAAAYRRTEIDRLTKVGHPRNEAERIVQSRQVGIIDGADELYFQGDEGPTQAMDVLLDPDKFACRYLADPVEPDYGGAPGSIVRSKAILRVNEDTGEVGVYSFAHGGRNYAIKLDRQSFFQVLDRAQTDGRDLLTLWKPLLVRHAQEMSPDEANAVLGCVARLLKIDKGPARAALEQERADFAIAKHAWLRRGNAPFDSLLEEESESEREERLAEEKEKQRHDLFQKCKPIATAPDILQLMVETQERQGNVGEPLVQKSIYLAGTSRLLPQPVNVVVKGESAGGKSHNVEQTLKLFPEKAIVNASGMSEKAMFYMASLKHRILYIPEATPIQQDDNGILAYAIRSLLSEGRLKYWRAPSNDDPEPVAQLSEVEGPTGFICTTTAFKLHPENETRMLSVMIDDSEEQTRRILQAIATRDGLEEIDFGPWHAFQEWLELSEHRVTIPFAGMLASLASANQTRMRRDFPQLLALIKTSAILHQATREKDESGQIIATMTDYAAARPIVLHSANSVETVTEGVRRVVEVIRKESIVRLREYGPAGIHSTPLPESDDDIADELLASQQVEITMARLSVILGKSRSTAYRWVHEAIEKGFLRNQQIGYGRNRPMQLSIDLPLSEGADGASILPTADELAARMFFG